jgi:ribonuclease D
LADFELIEKVADLEAVARDLADERVVGFDTEADSFYHYFDKTCLVQVATRRRIYLVDPIAMGGPDSLASLAPIFASPEIRTIFHAAEYDLYVLKRDCRFAFAGLFDTMICAQLLGYPSIGLAAIAERHFEVRLPKDEQRSDWSARPLRDTQLCYAAADVAHLIPLSERLERELRKAKRLPWAEEEFRALERREWPEREFDKLGYLRIKGARDLDSQSLSVLRELYLVRDRRAREIDRPAFKVLGNRTLLEIAQRRPADERELAEMKGVTELILRRFGRDILGAVQRGAKREQRRRPPADGSPRRAASRGAEALARRARQRARPRPGGAVPEHRPRGDCLRRPGERGGRGAAPRGEALVRAVLRRRGDRGPGERGGDPGPRLSPRARKPKGPRLLAGGPTTCVLDLTREGGVPFLGESACCSRILSSTGLGSERARCPLPVPSGWLHASGYFRIRAKRASPPDQWKRTQ